MVAAISHATGSSRSPCRLSLSTILIVLVLIVFPLKVDSSLNASEEMVIYPTGRLSRAEIMREVLAILQEEQEQEMKARSSSGAAMASSVSVPLPSPRRLDVLAADPMAPTNTAPQAPSFILPMQGVFMRIGVVIEPPLIFRKANANKTQARADDNINHPVWKNSDYGGVIIDMLRSHSTNLGFSYQIVEPEDGFFGVKQDNGTYNGLMGMYMAEEVDLLYSGLHVNAERAKLVSFTQAYLPSGYKILTKPVKRDTNIWFVLSPFSYTLWLTILGMVVFMASIFAFIDVASPYGKRVHGQPNWLYHSCGVLLNIDNFTSINHRGFAASILTVVWTFSTLAIVTLYTANMVSNLTVKRLEAPVDSIGDIVRKQVKVGTIASSASRAWTLEHYPALGNLEVQFKTFQDAVTGLRHGKVKAVIFVTAVVEAVANRPPCDLMTTGETFGSTFIGVGVRPGSDYYNTINDYVYQQITSGEIEKFYNAYLQDECALADPSAGSETIKVQDVRGLFYIMGIGIVIALACLLVQVVRFRFVLKNFGNILCKHHLDEHSFMGMVTKGSTQEDSLLLARQVKLVLLKLGMSKYEISVILSACDANTDGFLDPYELDSLKLLARRALSTHKAHVSPYSLNVRLWRLESTTFDLPSMQRDSGGEGSGGYPSPEKQVMDRPVSGGYDSDQESKFDRGGGGGGGVGLYPPSGLPY